MPKGYNVPSGYMGLKSSYQKHMLLASVKQIIMMQDSLLGLNKL